MRRSHSPRPIRSELFAIDDNLQAVFNWWLEIDNDSIEEDTTSDDDPENRSSCPINVGSAPDQDLHTTILDGSANA